LGESSWGRHRDRGGERKDIPYAPAVPVTNMLPKEEDYGEGLEAGEMARVAD